VYDAAILTGTTPLMAWRRRPPLTVALLFTGKFRQTNMCNTVCVSICRFFAPIFLEPP
jgi:hypothetical protein